MFKLFKNATVYAPDYQGQKDILVCFDKIVAIGKNLDISVPGETEVIDCANLLLLPGFIDLHVHICGGGGEGSYLTRTNEVKASDMLKYGVTTVVGVLGTDGITRGMSNLYAKAKQLELEGMSTYVYTGSYQVPLVTLTGSVQSDMVFVDKVIGVGEICLSDNRSFEPTLEELSRIAAQSRNGGLISGKAGLVHFHMGTGKDKLEYLFRLISETEIPKSQFLPTHVNRTTELFRQALDYVKQGGFIDLTAGFIPDENDKECVPTYDALKHLQDNKIDFGHITMSSDANGSAPVFDEQGNVITSDTVSSKILFDEIRIAVIEKNIPLEKALQVITINSAKILKIDNIKGSIDIGKHADFVLCDSDLNIKAVYAMGKKWEKSLKDK
jgi:beta-aspartyl-dipeptidase (metallo-type)